MHDADKEIPFVTDDGVKSGDGSLLSIKREAGAAAGNLGDSGARLIDARRCALAVSFQPLVGFRKLKK